MNDEELKKGKVKRGREGEKEWKRKESFLQVSVWIDQNSFINISLSTNEIDNGPFQKELWIEYTAKSWWNIKTSFKCHTKRMKNIYFFRVCLKSIQEEKFQTCNNTLKNINIKERKREPKIFWGYVCEKKGWKILCILKDRRKKREGKMETTLSQSAD